MQMFAKIEKGINTIHLTCQFHFFPHSPPSQSTPPFQSFEEPWRPNFSSLWPWRSGSCPACLMLLPSPTKPLIPPLEVSLPWFQAVLSLLAQSPSSTWRWNSLSVKRMDLCLPIPKRKVPGRWIFPRTKVTWCLLSVLPMVCLLPPLLKLLLHSLVLNWRLTPTAAKLSLVTNGIALIASRLWTTRRLNSPSPLFWMIPTALSLLARSKRPSFWSSEVSAGRGLLAMFDF